MRKLTPKQQRFVEEYLVDVNAAKACQRAGYKVKPSNADKLGSQLLGHAGVAKAIQKHMDKRSKRTEITADRVLEELAKLGFGNVQNLYDENGNLLHVNEMPSEVTATIQEVTEEAISKGGDEESAVVIRRKYKVADKKASLELLGKHLKLFTDKVEINGGVTVSVLRKRYDGKTDDVPSD